MSNRLKGVPELIESIQMVLITGISFTKGITVGELKTKNLKPFKPPQALRIKQPEETQALKDFSTFGFHTVQTKAYCF